MIAVDTNLLVCAHREDSPFEAWIEVGPLGRDRKAIGRSFAAPLGKAESAVLKCMMLASPRSWRPRVVDFRSRLLPLPDTHRRQSARGVRMDGEFSKNLKYLWNHPDLS
jgi:hypothetical protein